MITGTSSLKSDQGLRSGTHPFKVKNDKIFLPERAIHIKLRGKLWHCL